MMTASGSRPPLRGGSNPQEVIFGASSEALDMNQIGRSPGLATSVLSKFDDLEIRVLPPVSSCRLFCQRLSYDRSQQTAVRAPRRLTAASRLAALDARR